MGEINTGHEEHEAENGDDKESSPEQNTGKDFRLGIGPVNMPKITSPETNDDPEIGRD